MDIRKTCLQRAFELARSGKCLSVPEVVMGLKAERHDVSQVEGRALKKQLIGLINQAIKRKRK
jgi:hypothetical protein